MAAHANSATGHAGTETSLLVCSRSLQQIHRPLLALSAQASAQHIAETGALKIVHDFRYMWLPSIPLLDALTVNVH